MSRMLALLLLAAALATAPASAAPVGTAFTYQGELQYNGQPATGTYDFEFALFDLASGGSPLAVENVADQAVTAGLFTVELDYTDVPFVASQSYWLEVRVRDGASGGGYQPLLPRQQVTPSPYAINARSVQAAGVTTAAIADGAVSGGKIAVDAVTSSKILDGSVAGADIDATQVQRRVAGTCPPGSAVQAVDAAGAVDCQAAGSGTVTSVGTADGLTGGPVTTSGTLSIADGGVTSAKIADGGVASVDVADGSLVAADVNSASVQLRVTGNCSGGISSVNADGSTTCNDAVNRVRPLLSVFGTELHPNATGASSITIGTDGFPLIAVHHVANGDLIVVHCQNASCTSVTATAIDTAGDVGAFNSIGIDQRGFGVVSYYDATNADLKLALCTNLACTQATLRTIDSAGNVGKWSSLAFVGTNRPAIAYYDETNGNLKYALCQDDNLCSTAAVGTADAAANDVGRNASMLIFRNVVTIAYQDFTAGTLKVAQCSFGVCVSGAGVQTADATPTSGAAISMIRAANGSPAIYYSRNGTIFVVRCTNLNCTTFSPGTLVANENATFLAASMDAIGHPVLVFVTAQSPNDTLAVLRCVDPQCTSAYRGLEIGTPSGGFNAQPSIALGQHGFPLVSARSSGRTIGYVCDNPACGFGARAR